MTRKLLITGCSHAGGFEIDGGFDTASNREKSFGNVLAKKLDRVPFNLGIGGAANGTIARNTLEYLTNSYDRSKDDIFVLVCWSESIRMEVPIADKNHYQLYDDGNLGSAKFYKDNNKFMMINPGMESTDPYVRFRLPMYKNFIARNTSYLEIYSANLVLMLQNYLKGNNIQYMMCNTMSMFTDTEHYKLLVDLIDTKCYYNCFNNDASFFSKYRDLGYVNEKAVYWHHGEEPHRLYADELFKFYSDNYLKN